MLARIRERALSGDAESLAYTEWSVGLRDDEGNELRPEEVTPDMDTDEMVESANPGMGAERISAEHVRAEREAMDWRGWLVERCGIGAWPDTSGVAAAPVNGEEWNELADRDSEHVGEVVLAFDIGPDRRTALVACGRRGVDDLLHLELLDSRPGTGWLPERLEYLSDRHDVREVVADD